MSETTQAAPAATVVVVAGGPWSETLRCLMALPLACRGVAHEVVVVDDGTADETAQVLPHLPGVTSLRGDEPQGFAVAANAGASQAGAGLVLLLRGSAEPPPDLLAGLLDAGARGSEVGAVLAPPHGLLVSLAPFADAGGLDPAAGEPETELGQRLEAAGLRVVTWAPDFTAGDSTSTSTSTATATPTAAPAPGAPIAPFKLAAGGPVFASGHARLHLHAQIATHLRRLRPATVLEIGCGSGALGLALRESLDGTAARSFRLDGHRLGGAAPMAAPAYDRVLDGTLHQLLSSGERWDVILLVDVLDRLPKAEGLRLLRALLQRTNRHLLVTASAATDTVGQAERGLASTWSSEDFAPFRCRPELMRLPVDSGAWLVALAPPGEPTAVVPAAIRPGLAAVDAVWDGPEPAPRPLRIAYLLPHHGLTGGMKVLVEQVHRLRQRGHFVRAVYEGQARRAMPPWTTHAASEDVVVPRGASAAAALRGVDVVVCGWYQSAYSCLKAGPPALYLEQGHEHLFEFPQWHLSDWYQAVRQFDAAMSSPLALAAVSPYVSGLVEELFGRRMTLVPNGVDTGSYRPEGTPRSGRRVLLIGNPSLAFKGFDTAVLALAQAVRQVKGLEVTWVSQKPAPADGLPCPAVNLVDPPQADLPGIFRRHDLHVFTSRYEAFALPPLEAMASGVPVVSTDCGGIKAYAVDGDNALLVPVGDHAALAAAMVRVLTDGALRERLARRGRETAEAFSIEHSIDRMEAALRRVAARGRVG